MDLPVWGAPCFAPDPPQTTGNLAFHTHWQKWGTPGLQIRPLTDAIPPSLPSGLWIFHSFACARTDHFSRVLLSLSPPDPPSRDPRTALFGRGSATSMRWGMGSGLEGHKNKERSPVRIARMNCSPAPYSFCVELGQLHSKRSVAEMFLKGRSGGSKRTKSQTPKQPLVQDKKLNKTRLGRTGMNTWQNRPKMVPSPRGVVASSSQSMECQCQRPANQIVESLAFSCCGTT